MNYERNTVDVDAAVRALVRYDQATVSSRGPRGQETVQQRHPVRAVIMVSTYKAAARFIQKVKDAGVTPLFLNVSFVGSNALADGLKELGPTSRTASSSPRWCPTTTRSDGASSATARRLKKFYPDQHPTSSPSRATWPPAPRRGSPPGRTRAGHREAGGRAGVGARL